MQKCDHGTFVQILSPGFETSDYIFSRKLLAGRGMQSHDYKLFSFAPWGNVAWLMPLQHSTPV